MRLSGKRPKQNSIHPFIFLALFILAAAGILLIAFGLNWLATTGEAASPSSVAIITPEATPTLGSLLSKLTLTPRIITPTPIKNDPRPPTNTPTPIFKATGFYSVPINATPIPTQVLPPAAPFPSSCNGPGRLNILVIGMDGRSADYDRLARADAMALLGVNFADKTARVVSIPRDLWVTMPAYGGAVAYEDRINVAYALGRRYDYPGAGPAFQALAVSEALNVRIDRTIVLNFTSFENTIDAIGGADVEVAEAIRDERYPDDQEGTILLEIPKGIVHMDGRTSLMYARTRHGNSDFSRMQRQQNLMMAIRDRLLRPQTIPALPALAQVLMQSVRTNLSAEDIGLLGCVGTKISKEGVLQLLIGPNQTEFATAPSGASILKPRPDRIQNMMALFNSGQ
jgi:LCP family protein required for cell wall assembly